MIESSLMFLLLLISLLLAVNANHDVGYPMNCSQQISLQTCQLLGPTDWYLAFDSTTEKSTILQPLAASIFEKNLRKLRFDTRSGHRLSIFAAYSSGVALLENICRQSADLSKLNLAAWRPIFQLKKTGFFKTVESQLNGCKRGNFQSIVIMFIYGYKPEKRAEDDFLKRWREDFRERSIQIYIIYYGESYQKDNIYEKWLKNDLINGCFFYLPQSKPKMDHTAAQLINCICSKSEDCHTNSSWEQKTSKCFFVVENGVELCKADFGEAVIFRPLQKSRPSPMTCFQTRKNCNKSEIQECIDDCELKKWSHWSKCTFNANDKLYYRKRERVENNQSLGHFSNKSCRKWDTEACPTTTAPITLMVHIIDESTPSPIELGNIYILVVVGCMAAAISVIFIIICILIHKKSERTTELIVTTKFLPKNATASSSWANRSPPSTDRSVGWDHSDPTGLKTRTKSTKSQRKVSLPTRSEDLSSKYRRKNAPVPDRLLKKKNPKLYGAGTSSVDISQTRKVKRKSADDGAKLKPKLRKK